MDRRATLAALLGRKKVEYPQNASAAKAAPATLTLLNSGLDPYLGPWTFEQAAHLLRRTMFGPTYAQIKWAVEKGLDAILDQLFQELPMPDHPVNHFFQDDPYVPVGQTWIDAPYSASQNLRGYRMQSLRGWTLDLILQEGISIREKMTLFWHNHFAIGNINDPKFLYRHISLLRSYAWGNFRELVKAVTIDPAMLRFLNGNQNTRRAPNENFARELLELFTIGKGPQVGPGDYTNYTEKDISEMARVLTGWRDNGYNAVNPDVQVGAAFRPAQHDTDVKTLSHRFDYQVIYNLGDQEYSHLIDVIFLRSEVARYISRKLYRWFIYYEIDETTETNIIEPMAQLLVENDYEIQPVLRALLGSQHFFDMLNVGPMIKNPLDFAISAIKQLGIAYPAALAQRYNALNRLFASLVQMQMEYYNLPEVAGWKAYYQAPFFNRSWINATTLPLRMSLTDTLTTEGFRFNGFRIQADVLQMVTTLNDPYDPNSLIRELASILFPQPLTDNQIAALKEVLIPGLPDYEWTIEYGEYAANPENSDLKAAIESKLRGLFRTMLSMAEFHLS